MNQEQKAEMLRQLRAARDGRFLENAAGRYVIEGEARPNRKVREKLIYTHRWMLWQFSPKGMRLTSEGEAALRLMEAEDGR